MATASPPAASFFGDKNRAFWILQGAGWTGYLMLRAASGIANGMTLTAFIPILVSAATGYSLTLVMAALFRWLITKAPLFTWMGTVVTIGVALAAYSVIDAWVFTMINRGQVEFAGALVIGSAALNGMLLVAWSSLYYGINYFLLAERQTVQLIKLEAAASTAQLAMLRYQLNPHFLFNTLNSISTLVLLKQTDRANAMLSRLSSFLRYTLVNESEAQVTLEQEFETLKLYLEIEKMRFEDRLRATFELDPAAAPARLPSLLLQPLVENAIKYAVTPQEEGAEIAVVARLVGAMVRITVSDSGPGLNDAGVKPSYSTGVGLANIRDRLTQAFGSGQRFDTSNAPGGGFVVTVEIPFVTDIQTQEAA
ncbi:MAG: sensor histidine kinase [Sphingomonadaceae bacterium]|nr:sensor histidine kinase [Sphingomonadaceae bacterium]